LLDQKQRRLSMHFQIPGIYFIKRFGLQSKLERLLFRQMPICYWCKRTRVPILSI